MVLSSSPDAPLHRAASRVVCGLSPLRNPSQTSHNKALTVSRTSLAHLSQSPTNPPQSLTNLPPLDPPFACPLPGCLPRSTARRGLSRWMRCGARAGRASSSSAAGGPGQAAAAALNGLSLAGMAELRAGRSCCSADSLDHSAWLAWRSCALDALAAVLIHSVTQPGWHGGAARWRRAGEGRGGEDGKRERDRERRAGAAADSSCKHSSYKAIFKQPSCNLYAISVVVYHLRLAREGGARTAAPLLWRMVATLSALCRLLYNR
jgi:hypothetical protein